MLSTPVTLPDATEFSTSEALMIRPMSPPAYRPAATTAPDACELSTVEASERPTRPPMVVLPEALPLAVQLLTTLEDDRAPSGLLNATRGARVSTGLSIDPTPAATEADFFYFRRPHLGATAWATLAAMASNTTPVPV